MLVCSGITGWLWWNAQADHYTGLPINAIGQVFGDLLTAGLIAPMVYRPRNGARGSRLTDTDTDSRERDIAAQCYALVLAPEFRPARAEGTDQVAVELVEHGCRTFALVILFDDAPIRFTISIND
jgi:hypothetical protein